MEPAMTAIRALTFTLMTICVKPSTMDCASTLLSIFASLSEGPLLIVNQLSTLGYADTGPQGRILRRDQGGHQA